MKPLTKTDVRIEVICHPEHIPVKGNAMASGDDALDARVERKIIRQLEDGNQWAWCTVEVCGHFHGLTASEYLGCCNYKSEKDFVKNSGYYDDMVNSVVAELNTMASAIYSAVK